MKTRISLLGPLAAVALGGVLLCWPIAAPAASLAGPTGGKHAAAKEHAKTLATELQLTEQQKQQLKPIIQEQAQKLKSLRATTGVNKRQKHMELNQIRQEFMTRVKAILTPEQWAKWQELRGARGNRHAPKTLPKAVTQ